MSCKLFLLSLEIGSLQFPDQAVEVVRKRNKQQLVTVLHHWQIALATHQSRTRQAGDHYSSHRLSTALNHWRAGSAKIQRDRQTADKAHAFFLLRQAFGVWKAQLAGRKQQRFLEEKKIELVRRVFDRMCLLRAPDVTGLKRADWREETQRSIEGNRQADDFRQICNQVSLLLTNSFCWISHAKLSAPARQDPFPMDDPRHPTQVPPTRRLRTTRYPPPTSLPFKLDRSYAANKGCTRTSR